MIQLDLGPYFRNLQKHCEQVIQNIKNILLGNNIFQLILNPLLNLLRLYCLIYKQVMRIRKKIKR